MMSQNQACSVIAFAAKAAFKIDHIMLERENILVRMISRVLYGRIADTGR